MKDYFKFIGGMLAMFVWMMISMGSILHYLGSFLSGDPISFGYPAFGFLFGILTLPILIRIIK